MQQPIDRRTFLRGMGATIALPLLDAMVPARTALAAAMIAAVAMVAAGVTRPVSAAPPSGGYIVTLKDGIDAKAFAAAADARDGVDLEQVYAVALKAFSARLTASARAQLIQDPAVRFVSPNRTFKAFAQVLPTGVDRIEGDLSTASTNVENYLRDECGIDVGARHLVRESRTIGSRGGIERLLDALADWTTRLAR